MKKSVIIICILCSVLSCNRQKNANNGTVSEQPASAVPEEVAAQPVLRIDYIKAGEYTASELVVGDMGESFAKSEPTIDITVIMTIENLSENILSFDSDLIYKKVSLTYSIDGNTYTHNGAFLAGSYPLFIEIRPSETYSFAMTFNLFDNEICNSENYMFYIWQIIPTLRVEMKLRRPRGMTIISEPIAWESISISGE
ncbi:MAG: hypothetical protein J6K38_01680 [Alistipes sp.]|nr:hypothetical protein [Alistipes sp.]